MTRTATLTVPAFMLAIPLAPDALPRDVLPPEGQPAGTPTLDVTLAGTSLTVRAALNGKSYRRVLKQVDEAGAANVAVVLQGALKPPPAAGGPYVLADAGLQVVVKAPRPSEPGQEPPQGAGFR